MRKPGRQGLEFIRVANLGLWLIQSFMMQNQVTRDVFFAVYGELTWTILANFLQPLNMLFFFHAVLCISEITGSIYSDKHIRNIVKVARSDNGKLDADALSARMATLSTTKAERRPSSWNTNDTQVHM